MVVAMVTNFWHELAKIGTSLCALAFHNEWEDPNIDACVNTVNDLSTSELCSSNHRVLQARLRRADYKLRSDMHL